MARTPKPDTFARLRYFFNLLLLLVGFILTATVIGQFSALFNTRDSVIIAEIEEINAVNRFLEFHSVSHDMKTKIQQVGRKAPHTQFPYSNTAPFSTSSTCGRAGSPRTSPNR